MPARKKSRGAGWEFVPTDPAGLAWSNSIGFMTAIEGDLFAANLDFVRVGIISGEAHGAPRLLGELKPPTTFTRLEYFPDWPALAVIGSEFIQLLDVSNPASPRVSATFTYDVGHERALTFMGKDVYVTHENGVAWLDTRTGKPEHLFDIPGDEFFESYPTGLTSHGEFLFVAGRHCGLHVYRRVDAKTFDAVRSVKKGYTPTALQWWDPGRVLLMVGNEDVIAVDVRDAAAMKVMKSCKVKGVELHSPLVRIDAKTAFVAGGKTQSRNTLVLTTLDLSNPLEGVVSESFAHKDKAFDFDSASFVRVGDQVFVGGTYLETMLVFRRA
ncbi:MAG: hypothetical protein QM817_06645 [Archangium sp.]